MSDYKPRHPLGYADENGYWRVCCSNVASQRWSYVRSHRLIAAWWSWWLDIPYPPKAQVHHIDRNRKNNWIGNLAITKSKREHRRIHYGQLSVPSILELKRATCEDSNAKLGSPQGVRSREKLKPRSGPRLKVSSGLRGSYGLLGASPKPVIIRKRDGS